VTIDRDIHRANMFAAVAARYGMHVARELQRRHGRESDAIERAYAAALGIAGIQDVRRYLDRDKVTILECAPGHRATKTITATGTLDFAAGKWFATTEVVVCGIGSLAALLAEIERRPRWLVIRGRLIKGRAPGRVRRKITPDPGDPDAPYFERSPRKWLALDLDSFDLPAGVDPVDLEAVAAIAVACLPEPFRRTSCWAQLTSGAGIKPGGRVRLWFWLSDKVGEAFIKRWLRAVPGLDHSLFCPNEPHYIAAPVFDPGIADPVPLRSKLIAGDVDAVAVPELPAPPERKAPPIMAHVGTRRADRYMIACLRAIADAPAGQGRATCTNAALRLYGICKAGNLDPTAVTARIKRAMLDRGWADDEATRGMTLADVNRQLQWAWDHAEPRGLSR
jgi:hypothetical protein